MIRVLLFLIAATPAAADIAVAARTLPAQSILTEDDILMREIAIPGGVSDPSLLIGLEAKVALYAGRPIRQGDVGFPATVERNQILSLVYRRSGLVITTEGRALDRAGPGDTIRVMNLASRATVTAVIGMDGAAYVSY